MKDDRVWVTVPMPPSVKERIEKAAAKNDMSVSEYMQVAVRTYMERANEWTLRGPRKGSG